MEIEEAWYDGTTDGHARLTVCGVMFDCITLGDIKLDSFVVLPSAALKCDLLSHGKRCYLCLEYGAKIPVDDFEPQIAGSATNVAVGLARLGLKTAIYAVVGRDATGDLAFTRLREEHVDTRYLTITARERSSYSVVITYKDERTILTAHQPHQFRLPRLHATRWLYLSEMGEDYENLYHDTLAHARAKKIRLGFNPGAVQLRDRAAHLRELFAVTEVLLVNREEAVEILRKRNRPDIRRLIHEIWRMGPKVVVITDGARGVYAFDGGVTWFLPAFPARVVEMTGAGDSFACAFLAARMRGKPIEECLRWGAANAASVITRVGPQPGLLTHAEMLRSLRAHQRIVAQHAV